MGIPMAGRVVAEAPLSLSDIRMVIGWLPVDPHALRASPLITDAAQSTCDWQEEIKSDISESHSGVQRTRLAPSNQPQVSCVFHSHRIK